MIIALKFSLISELVKITKWCKTCRNNGLPFLPGVLRSIWLFGSKQVALSLTITGMFTPLSQFSFLRIFLQASCYIALILLVSSLTNLNRVLCFLSCSPTNVCASLLLKEETIIHGIFLLIERPRKDWISLRVRKCRFCHTYSAKIMLIPRASGFNFWPYI